MAILTTLAGLSAAYTRIEARVVAIARRFDLLSDDVADFSVLAGASAMYCTGLTALVGTVDRARVYCDGYAAAGDGGGGEFVWYLGSVTTADGGTVFGAGTGRWKRVYSGYVNVAWFGAVADWNGSSGTTNTTAIQAAISASRDVFIPEGAYKTGALTITRRTRLFGDGPQKSRLYSTVTGATDALTVSPPAGGTENTFYRLHDFGIENVTPGNGRYGVNFYLAASAYLSNSTMERVYVGSFGSEGVYFDNAIANTDGFFTFTVRRCWITNGLKFIKCGDSITVTENTITGSNVGVYASGTAAARQLVISENNVTCRGGAVHLDNCEQPTLLNNQLEQPGSANYNGATAAFVYLNDCLGAYLCGNTISSYVPSSTPATSTIFLDGDTTYTLIEKNSITKGVTYHVYVDSTCTSNTISETNMYTTAGTLASGVHNDLGADTRGVIRPAASITLANSWVAYDAANHPIQCIKHSTGEVTVSGSVKDGTTAANTTIATLPVGCRPPDVRIFSVAARNGATWGTAQLQVTGGGLVQIMLTPGSTEMHLTGIAFRVGAP